MIAQTAEKLITDPGYRISRDQACALVKQAGQALIAWAGKIRAHFLGNQVLTCSIINAKSGRCTENCAFCAQSAFNNTGIKTYPLLNEDLLVREGLEYARAGATRYSMVTSGFKLTPSELDTICRAAERLRKQTSLKICASIGVIDIPVIRQMLDSGITRYHHNLETARSYFDRICTTHEYDEDIQAVQLAGEQGLEICCGGIFGLGETWEQRVELALTLRDLNVDTIPLNFLTPVKGTRLGHQKQLPPADALTSIAITRFINPDCPITICGGREITLGEEQHRLFEAGASGLMLGNYLTTSGRDAARDIQMIQDLGLVANG